MLRLKIGEIFIDLDEKVKVRIQKANPLLSRDVIGGEYTFPFTIPNIFKLSNIIDFKDKSLVEGFLDSSITAYLYEDEMLLYKGDLTVIEILENSLNVSLKINSSRLSTLKGKKLRDIDFGRVDVTAQQQFIEWEIDNSYIGYPLQLILGQATFIQAVSTTVDAAIDDLITQIDGTYYYGSVPVNVSHPGTNRIRFEASWYGINPVLRAFFNTISMPSPPTATVVDSSDIFQIYNDNWMNLMNSAAASSYPTYGYTFFPVLNQNSLIYPDDTTSLPIIDNFFQNLYDTINGSFVPRNLFEVISGYFTTNSCVTPFMYLPYMFDKIAAILNISAVGDLHTNTEFKRLVCWSNYLVDLTNPKFSFDTNLNEIVDLKNVAPDVTVDEFLTVIKDSLTLGYMINKDQELEVVDLLKLLDIDYTGVLDWSNKEIDKKIQNAVTDYSGFSYTIELDELDQDNIDLKDAFDDLNYLGEFDDFSNLPEIGINPALSGKNYAFVKDENVFYALYFNSSTYVSFWDLYNEIVPSFESNVGDGDLLTLKISDTCKMISGTTSPISSTGSWKIPLVKEPMSYANNNGHFKNSKVRLLQYQGLNPDADMVNYPLGNSEFTDANNSSISELSTKFIGEKGLKSTRLDPWINFLRTSKPIDKYWNVTGLDLLEYDYKKMIFSNGSYYLIQEIQEQRPITGPTQFKVRKIELNG